MAIPPMKELREWRKNFGLISHAMVCSECGSDLKVERSYDISMGKERAEPEVIIYCPKCDRVAMVAKDDRSIGDPLDGPLIKHFRD
jgi:hypothetical protein